MNADPAVAATTRFARCARWAHLTGVVLVAAWATAPAQADPAADAALAKLADAYVDEFVLPSDPTRATLLGVHRYDDRYADLSRAAIDRDVRTLKTWRDRFAGVDGAALGEQAAGNLALLRTSVDSSLITLETLKPWQTNPDVYSSGLASSAFSLMERQFAPANERLRLLVAREKAMPAALQQAHANLVNPPRIYTEVALQQLPGTIAFFKADVPQAFAAADDPAVKAEFVRSNAAVIAALEAYAAWLKADVLPRSHGDFRLGAATFRAKLLADEMVDTPLAQLDAIGVADLRRNQREFARVAKELAPTKATRAVLAELGADHPAPADLITSFRATFDGLTRFLHDKQIIDVPSDVRPNVEETPPFMRATTFASMDTPGPFEPKATEAYFNVTLPEASWRPARTEEFMAQFSRPVISNVAVHEAYPGHYTQFLWVQRVPDRVRKIFGAASNVEGWAHYCEQMMLDEGYGEVGVGARDVRESKLLKLGQLQDALLRDARFLVGLRLHTGTMTFDQAVRFFVDEGYQSKEVGRIETTRGTADPTYLYYTLGKLQILKLRADLQARQGTAFRLKDFHDAFMREGSPPLRIVRKAMLHDDSPTL